MTESAERDSTTNPMPLISSEQHCQLWLIFTITELCTGVCFLPAWRKPCCDIEIPWDVDLKPENLLFRTAEDNSDLLIADFGLSRIMDEEQFHVLTTTCGTPGYMAPEIFQKTGHGKAVYVLPRSSSFHALIRNSLQGCVGNWRYHIFLALRIYPVRSGFAR